MFPTQGPHACESGSLGEWGTVVEIRVMQDCPGLVFSQSQTAYIVWTYETAMIARPTIPRELGLAWACLAGSWPSRGRFLVRSRL